MSVLKRVVPVFLAGLVLSACGGGGGGGGATPAVPANQPPIANAGPDWVTGEGSGITLDGSASRDPDGSITAFNWSQTGGPAAGISSSNRSTLDVSAPLVGSETALTFNLTVTDNDGVNRSDSVTVTVRPEPRPSTLAESYEFDGVTRAATLHTPASYVPGNPVVMLLHGGGGSMREVLGNNRTTRRWIDLADRDGFLLVVPNGYNIDDGDGLGDQQRWNDLRTAAGGVLTDVDDVAFLRTVLARADAARDIELARTYVTGSSNGGMMSMRMLVDAPDAFDGAVSFIGAMPEEAIAPPTMATPIMIVAGTEDQLILFNGGNVAGNPQRGRTRSIADTVDFWLGAAGLAAGDGVTAALPDSAPADGCRLIRTDHGAAPYRVVYIEMDGGGHTVPDPNPPLRDPGTVALLGRVCQDAHGIDLAWGFLQSQ